MSNVLMFPAAAAGPVETEVKKSRFLAYLFPVVSADEARLRLESLKEQYGDARHIVWAFRTGRLMPFQEGFTDDGEPAGTAGKPLRALLEGRQATNALLAVVRYFGGIKLGPGGLMRAYTEAARLVMESAFWDSFKAMVHFEAELDYTLYDTFLYQLKEAEGLVSQSRFTDKVFVSGAVSEEKWFAFDARIQQIASGGWYKRCEKFVQGDADYAERD